MQKHYYKSPIGILEIICHKNFLYSLKITDKSGISDIETNFSKDIKFQLAEYFSGKRKTFDIKMQLQGTDFQKRVWAELSKIPYGATKTYSEIAQIIGNGNAQRAVGSACNKNPVMIIIPCHRVVSKNGGLGGFAYGHLMKQKLLKLENYIEMI